MEFRRTQRSLDDYLRLARQHLQARAAALNLLKESAAADRCNSPKMLRAVGVRLAEADRAEKRHIAGLMGAWRDIAESLTRVADLLVDGGLLLHYVRLASTVAGNSTLRGIPQRGIAETAVLVEQNLQKAFETDAKSFVRQFSRAFDMSQL